MWAVYKCFPLEECTVFAMFASFSSTAGHKRDKICCFFLFSFEDWEKKEQIYIYIYIWIFYKWTNKWKTQENIWKNTTGYFTRGISDRSTNTWNASIYPPEWLKWKKKKSVGEDEELLELCYIRGVILSIPLGEFFVWTKAKYQYTLWPGNSISHMKGIHVFTQRHEFSK